MYFRKEIGNRGENLACKYLNKNNYKIIERNFYCKQGEIDIIALDNTKKLYKAKIFHLIQKKKLYLLK